MNARRQVKIIANNFEISNHTFVNGLVRGLRDKIAEETPGLEVKPIAKNSERGKISLVLSGQVVVTDPKEVDDGVRRVMDSLQNPSNLLDLIRQGLK